MMKYFFSRVLPINNIIGSMLEVLICLTVDSSNVKNAVVLSKKYQELEFSFLAAVCKKLETVNACILVPAPWWELVLPLCLCKVECSDLQFLAC